MGNKACAILWCHGVGNFEVKQAVFETCFRMIVVTVEERLQSKWTLLHGYFQCVNQD